MGQSIQYQSPPAAAPEPTSGASYSDQEICQETPSQNITGGVRRDVDVLVDATLSRSVKLLQPHQKQFIKAFMRSHERASIAIHSPGSGKTLMAMGAAKCYLAEYPDSRVIFVAPTSLITAHEAQLAAYERKLPGGRIPKRDQYSFYTYTSFANAIQSGELKMCNGALIICDEAQALKGAETQIFSAVHACSAMSKKVIFLSATPITNTDSDLINLMIAATGGPIIDSRTMDAILNNDQLMRAFFGCRLSWYKSDPKKMAGFFPKKETRLVPIAMDATTERTYESLENNKINRAIEGIFSLSGESSDTDLQSFFNGLRRISSSSSQKIEYMVDYILHVRDRRTNARLGITRMSLDSHTDKFIIFTHFAEHGSAKIIAALKRAGISYGIIDGSVSKAGRAKIEKDYVSGKIQVILISAAGSTGLNLFETGYIFLVEPSWNNSEVEQVEARGIRYLGHSRLPKAKQNILIMKLMLIKSNEMRDFEKIVADKSIKYDRRAKTPSIDIKMFVDSNRKQAAIDARLKMLESKVPSIEACGDRKITIGDFNEMRMYRRISAKIAAVPMGVRSSGSYYAPGKYRPQSEDDRISFNDSMMREIISGAGISRLSAPTAILMAGDLDILSDAINSSNTRAVPWEFNPNDILTRKFRLGIINWGINFATGSHVAPVNARVKKLTLSTFNNHCDLLIIIVPEGSRSEIHDLLTGRTFSEAMYKSEFDRIINGRDSGITIIAC